MAVEENLQPHQAQQFADTECRLEKYATTLTWGEIYRAIKEQVYVDLYEVEYEMNECDKKTWENTRWSRINQVAIRPWILPCVEFIRLMVKKIRLGEKMDPWPQKAVDCLTPTIQPREKV